MPSFTSRPAGVRPRARGKAAWGLSRTMVIVDISGVHHVSVAFCTCSGAQSLDMQLLNMGLYPATSKNPQTAFTFAVLDDVLLTAKECRTSIMNYYNKLRRLTDDAFPHDVPVSTKLEMWPIPANQDLESIPRTAPGVAPMEKSQGAQIPRCRVQRQHGARIGRPDYFVSGLSKGRRQHASRVGRRWRPVGRSCSLEMWQTYQATEQLHSRRLCNHGWQFLSPASVDEESRRRR